MATLRNPRKSQPSVRRPLRLCIVGADLLGDSKMTENAAALTGIAQTFASTGDDVTFLWVPSPERTDKIEEKEVEQLRQRLFEQSLINIVLLPRSKDLLPEGGARGTQSIAVYHYLREQQFDAVFFALEGGLAYYSLLAKETGVYTNPPSLHVIAQSPTAWSAETDKYFLSSVQQVTFAYMEKYSAETCDVLICTSRAILSWMQSKDWNISPNAEVILPLRPYEWQLSEGEETERVQKSRELVFCAGPEYHKGLTLFCDALDRVAAKAPTDFTVTMMGSFGQILGEHTGGMLLRRARSWPFELKLLPRVSPRECLSYIRTKGALAIFPAYASATNLWMSACIAEKLSFIGTTIGSIPEFLAPESHADCLCDPTAASLAQKIIDAMTDGAPKIVPSQEWKGSGQAWSRHLDVISASSPPESRLNREPKPDKLPLVSVVLVHHDRPQYLLQSVKSVEQQDYERLELIVVDDGSKLPESRATLDSLEARFKKRGWRILREKNRYLGAARNAGTRAAQGERILYLDDDNVLFKSAVSTLVRAMDTSGADICTCFQKVLYGEAVPATENVGYIQYITLGGSLDVGFIENSFGDANAMVRREVFEKIGYQVELFGRTGEDWEFFARAILAGLKLRVVPQALYWYRSSPKGMWRSSHWYDNRLPTLETFKKYGFKGLDHLYQLALGAHVGRWEMDSLRDNLRFSPSDARFLKLCDLHPESDEVLDQLAGIAASEGRPDTALTLLGQGQRSGLLSEVSERLDSKTELDYALMELTAGVSSAKALSRQELGMFVVCTLQPTKIPPLFYLEKDSDRLYLQSTGPTSVATLAAGCPASTVSVSLTISLDQAIVEPTEFMLLIVPMHLEPALAVEQADSNRQDGNSGWTLLSLPYQSRRIEARLPAPSSTTMNLVVALRPALGHQQKGTTGCFSEISVKRLLGAEQARRPRIGPPPTQLRARECTREEFAGAKLITNYPSLLPLLLFPAEGGLFLRPSKTGPVVAVAERIFPPFARQAIGYVEIAHEEASPFEFAMALSNPGESADWRTEIPRNCVEFSGWKRVEEKFQLHEIVLEKKQSAKVPFDLNFAIRLPRRSEPSPANTFWRKLVFMWDQ
jgi:GT2 family glycosyltransferase